jgi:hypothetical protein
MDEAKRFLRFVTPGLVFLTITLILLYIICPDVANDILKNFKNDSGVGIVIATLLGSGGVGFIFSVIHHIFHWNFFNGAYDHTKIIIALRKRKIIQLRSRDTGELIDENKNINSFQAWTIFNAMWQERLGTSESYFKSADTKASSLGDLVHSTGTARVAAVFAWIFTLIILYRKCEINTESGAILCFIFGNILAIGFVILFHAGYRKVQEGARRTVIEVFDDALTKERLTKKEPIDTYVDL